MTYGLREAGFEVVCMEARQVAAALSAMRNKTDRHDARGIAQILRSGWYSRVHVKSVESHHLRALLTSRKVMQRKCIDLENEIRGLLKVFGVKLPMRLSRGAFNVAVRDTVESDPALSHALLPMLQARQMLFDTFMELDRRVRKAAHEDEVCTRFMGIPGVGEITALSFKAAVDDPTRFKSSRTVGAHFGLTPRRFQSGEKDNPGRISHASDSDVRATLYAAANAMLMRSIRWSSLKAWGMRLMKTKGRRRAIVAVSSSNVPVRSSVGCETWPNAVGSTVRSPTRSDDRSVGKICQVHRFDLLDGVRGVSPVLQTFVDEQPSAHDLSERSVRLETVSRVESHALVPGLRLGSFHAL
ncbi:IS110 family transposase [Brevundimonas sp.]|uniref:IS110 family transposase n=1 Tax=Brevundimonas sp. TaxID=1871086 RepID=UPI0037C03922